jgi:hypothetical protein
MLVTIDTEELINNGINAHLWISLIVLSDPKGDQGYTNKWPLNEHETTLLRNLGLLTKDKTVKLSSKAKSLSSENTWFKEFTDLYPQFCVRPDGTKDALRLNLALAKKKYTAVVKKCYSKHLEIINALKAQLSTTNNLAYMPRIVKWLENEMWEAYKDMEITDTGPTYGTNLE